MNLLCIDEKTKKQSLHPDSYRHLAIDELINMICVTDDDKAIVQNVFSEMITDTETIRFRQSILKDLIDNTELCNELDQLLNKLNVLNEYYNHNHFNKDKKSSIWELITYAEEMDIYRQIIVGMNELFDKYDIKSEGLKQVAANLKEVIDSDRINELEQIIESLKADTSTIKSVTLGINLDSTLYPEEIIFLNFSNLQYKSRLTSVDWAASIGAQKIVSYKEPSAIMKFLTKEVEHELGKKVKRTKSDLKKYINLKGYFLLNIIKDMKFYILMAKFAHKLSDKGCAFTMPEIDDSYTSVDIKGIYNIRLTENDNDSIVKNDFSFSEKEKIYILTGPNRGGKTMLTQAVGLAAFMASQGLFVMADSYKGFPFNNILTHFPADENLTLSLGRLGEEAVRVQQIVKEADDRTLVLFNETYSSTCASDGLYLAKDLVHILKHNNVPVIFNTHIHELARSLTEINSWDGPSDVVSLSMQIVNNVNTFKVIRSEPDSCSYAHNIALKYGITYDQMLAN